MKRISLLISRYLLQAILPYLIFSWLLLSVILFAQQASRFADIFFSVNIPSNLIWQLTLALIPNVISFTCPMAILVGTIIGLSKMQGDSELVAIRAAGVGNLQITLPIILLGILLSIFAFFVNLRGVPLAAQIVRSVALQTAIRKLESPIEPGVFNTEVAGYTIYVKGGDLSTGTWKNIFIYSEDPANGLVRLITSSNGRIDVSGDSSELVLDNATVSTFPKEPGTGKFISENIGQIRFAIQTRRGELIQKLASGTGSPEELGLTQLAEYAATREGKDRTEAQIIWARRIILSISPLIFCLLGAAMILRFNRGSRGFGSFLALIGLVAYFLLTFLGEQLARTGQVSVFVGSLMPIAISAVVILWLNLSGRLEFWSGWSDRIHNTIAKLRRRPEKLERSNLFVDLTTGLRDFDLVINLVKYFVLTLCFIGSVFVIFTAFELWKFAGTMDGGIFLLAKYLFYLLPFIYIQLSPSAAMVATLATYVIKSRQNEIVTWTSAGQSVYRLLMPCFMLMVLLGILNYQIQERILPRSNEIQDEVRTSIRSGGAPINRSGKLWLANNRRIYSFELAEEPNNGQNTGWQTPAGRSEASASDNENRWHRRVTMVVPSAYASSSLSLTASDNEKPAPPCPCVKNLTVYEFTEGDKAILQTLYRGDLASWSDGRVRFIGSAERTELREGKSRTLDFTDGELDEGTNPFSGLRRKPSYMNVSELKAQRDSSLSDLERQAFAVALQKKYATLLLPLIIGLFTAPFALSLSHKGKAVTVGYAVGLWLVFTGITSAFEQFGLNGYLDAPVAIWGPLMFFGMLGVYLLSKVRT